MNCKLTLGEKLKDLRTAAGLSLVELEEATGISKSALGSYESDDTKKEITIAPLITLAKYYGVTTDYLLGMTDNKEQHLFPVDELGLDDATVEILKSGDLNVRLICEMIKNPAFANFLSDMEIYVDNLAAMQIHNMNKYIEFTRAKLQGKGTSTTDHYMKTLEAATIKEDDYFANLLGNDIAGIAKDIKEAHKKDSNTGSDTTEVDEIIDALEQVQTADNATQAQMIMYSKMFKINFSKMDPYEFKTYTDILQRYSDAFKMPKGNGRGKKK